MLWDGMLSLFSLRLWGKLCHPLRQAAGLTGLRASSERVLGAAVCPLQHSGAGGLQQLLPRPALREKLPGAGFPNLLDFQLPALLTKAPRKHKNSPAIPGSAPQAEGLGEEAPLTRRVMAPQTISPPGCFSSKILILNRTSLKARTERKMGHGAT